MKLASNHLEAFYAVARTRNFTKAAELVRVTQSALSQRILNLESEIQTTLFIRDRSGLELTEAAQELLRYCQLQEKFEEEFLGKFQSKNSNELTGTIRIAGFSSVMRSVIFPALNELACKNRNIQIQAQSKELYEMLPMLKRGEVDFIVLDHKEERSELESLLLGVEKNVLVEPKNYKGPDVYLDHDEKDDATFRYFRLSKKSQSKLKRHFVGDIYGIMDGVRLGLGKALLPLHLLQGLASVEILNPSITLDIPVVVHFFNQPFYTRLHEAVIHCLKEKCPRFLDGKK